MERKYKDLDVGRKENLISNFAVENMLLSLVTSLAGIFAAISTYMSYSSILTGNPHLITALVFIIFQSILASTNFIVMMMMKHFKSEYYLFTKAFAIIS